MKKIIPSLFIIILTSCNSSSVLYQIEREPEVPFSTIKSSKITFEGLSPKYVAPVLYSVDSANALYALELSRQFEESLPSATLITPQKRSSESVESDYLWKITKIESGDNYLTRETSFTFNPATNQWGSQTESQKVHIVVYIDFIDLKSKKTLFKLESMGEFVKDKRYDYWKRALWSSITPVVHYIVSNGKGFKIKK